MSATPTTEDPNVNIQREPWSGTMKFDLLRNISLGYAMMWIAVGLPLAFYVRAQTDDHSQKNSYCQ